MSYRLSFCPTCGTRRVAYGNRCSVCDRQVPRTSTRAALEPSVAHTLVTWRRQSTEEEKKPVAA